MSPNEIIIKAFADQFEPPLTYVRTLRINNIAFPDAWQVSYWNNDHAIGVTCVAYEGQIHAFIEAAGRGTVAVNAGRCMAEALKLLTKEPRHGAA